VDNKIAEAFETLRGLFGPQNTGRQWASAPRARPHAGAPEEYRLGVSDVYEILEAADERRVYACGLADQLRLRSHHKFVCSCEVASEQYRVNCLGSIETGGRVLELGQTLICETSTWFERRRTILESGAHVGRSIRLGYRSSQGVGGDWIIKGRKPYTIERNFCTCLWLDRPVELHMTGYLVAIFQ
jgi:hypothetical protein